MGEGEWDDEANNLRGDSEGGVNIGDQITNKRRSSETQGLRRRGVSVCVQIGRAHV